MKVISFLQSNQISKAQEYPESIISIRKCSPVANYYVFCLLVKCYFQLKQNKTLLIPDHESSTKYQSIYVLYYCLCTCNEHYCFAHLFMPVSLHSVINLILKYSPLWYYFKMPQLVLFTSPSSSLK